MADKLKFSLALLLLAAGVGGFYYLGEQPMIVRVLSVLIGLGVGVAVAWFTEPGSHFIQFSREAIVEAKKVVWPSKRETVQTTGVVFAFVLIMAVVLWTTDKSLEWVLYDLILGWKKL
ncbi:MAG: preprotein translocase subunit SecE [Betaproteobacteria bacterium HGW-Betaproteobacteria-11]|nr:MAG: preprotein translocase subunit SecE [Betaproteobacteria bacterium HGW-Betaproteobacteria-11]